MASKDKLANLLSEVPKPSGPIKRGQGVRLSTEATPQEPPQRPESATSHSRTNAPSHRSEVVRVNRGYKLREDLIKACKRLALDTDRNLYEVMEEALREHLHRHGIETSP